MIKSHPTRRKLIETVLDLSAETDFQRITIDSVLDRSGVSKGSLYYHFSDFPDLVGSAMAQSFSVGVDRSIQQMTQVLRGCVSRDAFLEGIKLTVAATLAPGAVDLRLNRARIIGATQKNPKLRRHIEREQARMTAALEELFLEARAAGWLNRDFDTRAAAVFIQAYTLGKIVDDVSDDPVDQDNWFDLIMMVVERVFMV